MRISLQTVLCCCIFTAVLPPVKGATDEPDTTLKKRFRVWLLSHTRRETHHNLMTAEEMSPDFHSGTLQDRTAPSTSLSPHIRPKRSTKPSGCALITCLYHDLVHLLHETNNKQREPCAPLKKMGINGYGRRRRSLSEVSELPVMSGYEKRCCEALLQESRKRTNP
ncbi:adrenomedullin 4 isoform X1 [Oryzias latipes]|uniref:Adrenomedullin 4 n=1 Tax=Oryzias latipes TaxID=8090 RepID=Q05K89_ORYLA|nr:adrenomedullin b precursor [Oryzias latipes]XP_011474014.1 adrenomedullin 4 isoform X1 [Oryzias latipes]BAF34691.1 adrenomedullin 4 [Oryzias latipes]